MINKINHGIYMVKNKINDKVYIGQSTNIKRRWKEHRNRSNSNNKKWESSHFYRSIRKYGIDNFEMIILEECSLQELNEREIYYINVFNSSNDEFGYNKTTIINGDSKNTVWNEDSLLELKILLKDFDYSIKDIANIFNVNIATIHYINRGDFLTDKNENYPIRNKYDYNKYLKNKKMISKKVKATNKINKNELENLIIKNSFEEIGRNYNVSGKTISNWCKELGLPYKRSDIKNIYKDRIGDSYLKQSRKTKIDYPSTQEIVDCSFKYNYFTDISKHFGINYRTFRWYCQKNGIPTDIEELRELKQLVIPLPV